MPRNCDEDSGRSSCSAASINFSPIMEMHKFEPTNLKPKEQLTQNMDLTVSTQPRNFANIIKSPNERDPFPSCRIPRNHRNPVFSLFENSRLGGLSNAHSTLNIACSTQIENSLQGNSKSVSILPTDDIKVNNHLLNSNFRRGKPVQRAASRLYKAENRKGKEGCIGPEFIVRASQPPKHIDLTLSAICDKRVITVVLLNGQKVEIVCDPNTMTAGQIFEALVFSEKYEHNFMLGIAILIGGDFVFLPDDYKIKKVAPEKWHKNNNKHKGIDEDISVTLFLRIKFFLPIHVSNNVQGGEWTHRVYLQLRRATVEGQMISTIQNLILLAGYALHIEFGEFSYREHGTADYFLLEHYLPEFLITNDMSDVKFRMKRAHETRRGLDKSKAIINYITLAQTFRDYGAHFYSAIWATRDGFCRDVWLSIGPRGVTLYSRTNAVSDEMNNTNRIVLQSLPWHHIHTFYYNKKSLYIMPNSYCGLAKVGIKYKLKMLENKSYFAFWLASLHHRLYLKLYAKDDFINCLSSELKCPIKDNSPNKMDCSNYQDSYNLAMRNPVRIRRPVRRRFKVDLFKSQNKENEKPNTEELLRQILSPPPSDESMLNSPIKVGQRSSSNEGLSSSESSLPRRHGVKMGTRVFNEKYSRSPNKLLSVKSDGDLAMTQSDSDDLSSEQRQCNVNSMKLLPARSYSQNMMETAPTAYVLESPKVYSDVFNYDTGNESCVNTSIFDRLDNMECVQGERIFVTAVLERDKTNALGLQVAEGSDGNVYIKSITPGSAADLCRKLQPGDQIIAVNGQTLLNLKYDKALNMLQTAPQTVELIVLQNSTKSTTLEQHTNTLSQELQGSQVLQSSLRQSIASALDAELTDDELLNEEALKTIYALIKLTKDKVINRMRDKSSRQATPNKSNLQKCYSENKVYDESDVGNYTSQENTPQKKNASQKFNTWRGQLTNRPKRRPLSLSIPTDVNIPEDYLDDDDFMKKSSLKSIQSSLNSLDKSIKSSSSKNVALPRNYGLGRKWLGPVRYPVTPCKNNPSHAMDSNVIRRHFVYGTGDSDEEQIFL
ncbi:tyrosine-protein phosphatase non-receptor type 13 [Bicyclus anynana]|uniref:Tyrosine-protein phosphatase non-receptor type 13-like n=1 Tax=Bicyclus anynana TaxID=110368 RepID=A0A6J1NF69_BICAN|nr:tyrosine-protein phosphatase non-receptor type 13 [Bicyclus anynana]XP_023946409.1 tyrosine-protein phosphatase non-receptor type 13 [Bicyclus anynana]XP_023946410.1 tyrosine-protein phosphatase non-receptor type 13 [Bicyclus anynana]XP_023946411.1 tyrosine-protein phosphatase non-receptor type 13 [Bicyclus anynana]